MHSFPIIIFLFFYIQAVAQKLATIDGQLNQTSPTEVRLFKIEYGTPAIISSVQPEKNGKFEFQFFPDYEGLYMIGTGTAAAPSNNYKFWLKPGDHLSLHFADSSYALTGADNSKENQVLDQWHKIAWPLEWKSVYFEKGLNSTYVDFFPLLNKKIAEANTWLASQKGTGNKKFDRLLKKIVDADIAFFTNTFLRTPRTAHPKPEDLPEYCTKNTANVLFKNTDDVYFYPWGIRLFMGMVNFELLRSRPKNQSITDHIMFFLSRIQNDTLKGDFALSTAKSIQNFDIYNTLKDSISQYILTDFQKKTETDISTAIAGFKIGARGYEFKLEDASGKQISFSNLQGKIVLIDVWATWCVPCMAEIPHLKKLEEEMKGKNIAIVSISVDELKDKEKWKTMVEEKHLGGIQLFANGQKDFTDYYRITGIPRFMLFDKQGKIITIDAPRPSSSELKALIERYL